MQPGPAQAAGVGKGEQPLAPGHQRGGIGRAGQQVPPVAQREDEIPGRPLVGLIAGRGPQKQVTRGVEIVRVRCLGIGPRIAVAVVAEPADRHRHLWPGRVPVGQPVEQCAVDGDGLIAVGPDGRDRGQVPRAGPLGRQSQPMLEQGPEPGTCLSDLHRGAGRVTPAARPTTGGAEHRGQGRTRALDRRFQVWPGQYRTISDVCHPDPLCGLGSEREDADSRRYRLICPPKANTRRLVRTQQLLP
jgi:hypothetical protein